MFKPKNMGVGFDTLGPAEVCAKWGIDQPSQVIDILGLMGDASDNIPGCPGVGEKTAVTLVQQFGNIANLLEHTDQLKGKLKERVEENREQIALSRWLAQIVTDVPITLDLEALAYQEPDREALINQFSHLEMRSLINRKFGGDQRSQPAAPAKPPAPAEPEFTVAPNGDITFHCKRCGQEIEAPADMAGSEAECPMCGTPIHVPTPSGHASIATVQSQEVVSASVAETIDPSALKNKTIRIDATELGFDDPAPAPKDAPAGDASGMISFFCPGCHQEIEATADLAGTSSECPNCGTEFVVPFFSEKGEWVIMFGQVKAKRFFM